MGCHFEEQQSSAPTVAPEDNSSHEISIVIDERDKAIQAIQSANQDLEELKDQFNSSQQTNFNLEQEISTQKGKCDAMSAKVEEMMVELEQTRVVLEQTRAHGESLTSQLIQSNDEKKVLHSKLQQSLE